MHVDKSIKISKTSFQLKPKFSQNPINKILGSGSFQSISHFSRFIIIIALK